MSNRPLLSRILAGCLLLLAVLTAGCAAAQVKNTDSIIILYENDVHCAAEGYSKLSAMKQELLDTYAYVGVVSSGDFAQGGTLGSVSKGGHMVELMNLVGYDAVALGNHEFDYGMTRLDQLAAMLDTRPVCCNFYVTGNSDSYYPPYTIVSYGDVDIAYVGILTPETLSATNPAQFQDADGNFIFTFRSSDLYAVVQSAVDAARGEGADYVIALSHVGLDETGDDPDIVDLIGNTSGIDAVLDAHTHDVIEGMSVDNKLGQQVLLTSTGTEFAYIGKLTITGGSFTSQLISTDSYQKTDEAIDAYLASLEEKYADTAGRVIGESLVDLVTCGEDGNRLVRNGETNLGNFCADALRTMTGADISYINGGSLRADIDPGTVTYDDLCSVLPFGTRVVTAEVTGQVILDMLEMAAADYPGEGIAFPHTSGITFCVNTALPSPVTTDENGNFTGVSGTRRVYNVQILDAVTGAYTALDPEKTYVLASIDYFITSYGGGMTMLRNARNVQKTAMLDVACLEAYITQALGGVIDERYARTDKRITFTDGFVS